MMYYIKSCIAYDVLYIVMYCLLQYKQVQAFIPETFHKIKVSHDTPEGKVDFNWKRCLLVKLFLN